MRISKEERDMSEKKGTKELGEVVQALGTVLIILGPHIRDGIQLGKDVQGIYADVMAKPEVVAEVQAAVKDIKLAADEAKDLDLGEVIALAIPLVQRLPEILKAWSKPQVPPPAPEAA